MTARLAIRLSISGHDHAATLLTQFVDALRQHTEVQLIRPIHNTASASAAEAVLSVPFSYKEQVRIDWNIFIADYDGLSPDSPTTVRPASFDLESVAMLDT